MSSIADCASEIKIESKSNMVVRIYLKLKQNRKNY